MMNSMNPVNASALIAKQFQVIQQQRYAVGAILLSLAATIGYARYETCRAERWRAQALSLQNLRAVEKESIRLDSARPDARYYAAALIGEDGSQTPLTGKAIRIDLGGRPLEIYLMRQEKDRLFTWAPVKRDDKFFNRVIFRPHCSNAFSLELERVNLRSDSADAVVYTAP